MKSFFNSRRIAVVGASRDRGKVGNVIYRNLVGGKNKVFPINPKADMVEGRKAYSDILSIPYPLDMAIIATPAKTVPSILEQCGKKEISSVVIISAGFSEAGNKELEKKIERIIKKYGIKLIGPNVLGIINPYRNINASFFQEMPKRGNIAIISQSGAVGTSLLDKCLENEVGISGFVSLGNMVDRDFISALEYFGTDVRTEVIIMYIESLKDGTGQKFVELCEKIGKNKKIIAIKAGKSKAGQKAESTHTASLSSPTKIYSGAFKQSGIIEMESLQESFKLARILSNYDLGNKAGIITNAGGLGVLAADSLSKNNIRLPKIPKKVLKRLDDFLPEGYSRNNPLDILGDALSERYEKTVRILEMHDLYDFQLLIVSPQAMTQPLETAEFIAGKGKPVFPCFVGGRSFKEARDLSDDKNVIQFNDIQEAGRVLGKAVKASGKR